MQYSDNLTSLYRIIQDFKGDGSVPPETAKLWADKELLDQFKEELQVRTREQLATRERVIW